MAITAITLTVPAVTTNFNVGNQAKQIGEIARKSGLLVDFLQQFPDHENIELAISSYFFPEKPVINDSLSGEGKVYQIGYLRIVSTK